MTASTLCFRAAVLMLLAGMIWGLQMGLTGNHSAYPAHAHLTLLGFVAPFLFGIFYRLDPKAETNRLAIPQVWIWIVSTIVMSIGIALIRTGQTIGIPITAIGALVLLTDAVLFAWLVFRSGTSEDRIAPNGTATSSTGTAAHNDTRDQK